MERATPAIDDRADGGAPSFNAHAASAARVPETALLLFLADPPGSSGIKWDSRDSRDSRDSPGLSGIPWDKWDSPGLGGTSGILRDRRQPPVTAVPRAARTQNVPPPPVRLPRRRRGNVVVRARGTSTATGRRENVAAPSTPPLLPGEERAGVRRGRCRLDERPPLLSPPAAARLLFTCMAR